MGNQSNPHLIDWFSPFNSLSACYMRSGSGALSTRGTNLPHLSVYAIPLLIYDVMYDITTTPYGTHLITFLVVDYSNKNAM